MIGIDRYRHGNKLTNAVGDARGAAALFGQLGFEQVAEPLLDERATGQALHELVTDELMGKLGPEDSLVLFYAGHGATQAQRFGDQEIKTGYLLPVDADPNRVSTWIELHSWLRTVARIPAKHILVLVDACHSGIALDPRFKTRDIQFPQDAALPALHVRRSRRIITSALDEQVALDGGPVPGHSLFTGCLIEGLTGGLRHDDGVTTGSELGVYVQRRVRAYAGDRQTPDFGAFDLDDRGEMAIPLVTERHTAKDAASDASSKAWPATQSPRPSEKKLSSENDFVVDSNPNLVLINGLRLRATRIEDLPDRLTLALSEVDGQGEAALRGLSQQRTPVEIAYGNRAVTGKVAECRLTHENGCGANLVVRVEEPRSGMMAEAGLGGPEPLSADDIATLRASRILFNDPPAPRDPRFDFREMFIRGGLHGTLAITESPIPKLLQQHPREERLTWETVRLVLLLQLHMSGCIEHVELLRLTVRAGRLVRIEFRARRPQYYMNVEPYLIELDRETDC